jgi:membrane protein implicated in regulation of membrane protease activity
MSVRVSPISRSAALLIVVIGILTFYFVDEVAGIIFIALGVILYWLLYRFTRRVVKEVEGAKTGKPG